MNHHLNQYYRKLQARAEECHRDDMSVWQWMHESETNANALNMGVKVYAPCEKKPISEAKEKIQNSRAEQGRMWIELYEKNRKETDDGEFETKTIKL